MILIQRGLASTRHVIRNAVCASLHWFAGKATKIHNSWDKQEIFIWFWSHQTFTGQKSRYNMQRRPMILPKSIRPRNAGTIFICTARVAEQDTHVSWIQVDAFTVRDGNFPMYQWGNHGVARQFVGVPIAHATSVFVVLAINLDPPMISWNITVHDLYIVYASTRRFVFSLWQALFSTEDPVSPPQQLTTQTQPTKKDEQRKEPVG